MAYRGADEGREPTANARVPLPFELPNTVMAESENTGFTGPAGWMGAYWQNLMTLRGDSSTFFFEKPTHTRPLGWMGVHPPTQVGSGFGTVQRGLRQGGLALGAPPWGGGGDPVTLKNLDHTQ